MSISSSSTRSSRSGGPSAAAAAQTHPRTHRRRNILLITTDEQRTETLSCYGSSLMRSPSTDRLAAEGVLFREAHAASPVCSPSRTSWVTGLHVPSHYTWMNGIHLPSEAAKALPSFVNALRAAGYHAMVVGKTHFQQEIAQWDVRELHASDSVPAQFTSTGREAFRDGSTPVADFYETAVVNRSLHLINSMVHRHDKQQSWFLWASFVSPHTPYWAPHGFNATAEYRARVPARQVALQPCNREESEKQAFPRHGMSKWLQGREAMSDSAAQCGERDNRRRYFELAAYVDVQVGRLLDHLDAKRLTNSTLVTFTSDHGSCLGDHYLFSKYSFFDCSWRVPLLMRGPGVPRGATREFASGVDLAPTLLGFAGVPRPAGMQGFDLLEHRTRCCGVPAAMLQDLALVTRRWKLVWYQQDDGGLLFDRTVDPRERSNLFNSSAHAPVRARLLQALLGWASRLVSLSLVQHPRSPMQVNSSHGSPCNGWGEGPSPMPHDQKVGCMYTAGLDGTEPELHLQRDLSGWS